MKEPLVTDQSTEPDTLQEPPVTDQHTEAEKIREYDSYTYTGRKCGNCGGPLRRFPVTVRRNRRRDTRYCSGKCRTAACRKREKPVLRRGQMENFNNKGSWIAMGRHELGPTDFEFDPADADRIALASKLNNDDLYQVTLEGKTRTVTFEHWHGLHALFYSVRDDWRFIIWIDDLRQCVKRVKRSCDFPCDCPNPNDCSHICENSCGQPATVTDDEGHHLCRKHYTYNEACKRRGRPSDDNRTFYVDGKPVPTSGTED